MSVARRLALLHLHQRSAALDARECLAAAARTLEAASDVLVLGTCHRIELYAAIPADADPRAWFGARLAPEAARVLADAAVLTDEEVARHLFRVACGLDSAVRGEGQILGQIRRAYDAARARGRVDPFLSDLLQHALHLAREVRATTPLGSVRRSVGSLAVDEALRHVAAPARATVLVVGAGEIGKLASRALASRVGRLVIANRDRARAEAVSDEVGAEVVALDDVDAALGRADVVISAADTRGAILTAERLAARLALGPLVVVDIAVPRSVDASGRQVPGLVYRSVDDLVPEADEPLDAAFARAEGRCDAEAAAFRVRSRARDAAATIQALHAQAERVRNEQLARTLARLGHLDARDRRIVEALSSSLTNALLHAPTVALREDPDRAGAAERLFGLDRAGPARESPPAREATR